MTKPQCYNSSLCEEQGDSLLPLGLASSANFVYDANQLSIQYPLKNSQAVKRVRPSKAWVKKAMKSKVAAKKWLQ